ncbi:MAG: ABC transporter permease [Gemmatimonas sp.]
MLYLLRRLLHVLSVVVVATTLGFFVLHIVPGDPLQMNTEQTGRSDSAQQQLRAQYGLDQPITRQYTSYLKRAATGDWGTSIVSGRPVSTALADALRNTLLLSGSGLFLAMVLGMGVGAFQGWRPQSVVARLLGSLLTALYIIPEFILAIVLLTVFAFQLSLFPVGGSEDALLSVTGTPMQRLGDLLWHLALPALTLAVGWGAAIARQQRHSLTDIRNEDFVRTARAKGLAEINVFRKHALPAALAPVIVVVGLMLPVLVGGAVVVETVFAWPGLGSLVLKAINARDYPLVSGAIVLTGVVVASGSLLTDAVLVALNPRLRSSAAEHGA